MPRIRFEQPELCRCFERIQGCNGVDTLVEHFKMDTCKEVSTEWIQRSVYFGGSVADPDPASGAFLTPWIRDPGSGIGFSGHGSQTQI